jgi:hypothetical protein
MNAVSSFSRRRGGSIPERGVRNVNLALGLGSKRITSTDPAHPEAVPQPAERAQMA